MNSFLAQSSPAHAICKQPIFRPGSTQFYHATSAYVGCAAWLRNDFVITVSVPCSCRRRPASKPQSWNAGTPRRTRAWPFPLLASATARVIGAAAGHLGTCCFETPPFSGRRGIDVALLREARDDGSDWLCGLGATWRSRPLIIGPVEERGRWLRDTVSRSPMRDSFLNTDIPTTRVRQRGRKPSVS